jgi:hypothetical protein
MLDLVVDRREMKAVIARALRFMRALPAEAGSHVADAGRHVQADAGSRGNADAGGRAPLAAAAGFRLQAEDPSR